MLPILAILAAAIVVFALATWKLFMRKVAGLVFPMASDGSSLPLFTLQRLKCIAIVHTLIMLACTMLILLFLW